MKSNMKNKKTPASTNKKKSLPAASSRSRWKAAREGVRNSQSNDGSYLISDANGSSEVPAMQLTSNSVICNFRHEYDISGSVSHFKEDQLLGYLHCILYWNCFNICVL